MSKHTPGSWTVRRLPGHLEITPDNELGIHPTLARIEKWAREGVNESEANARLIAAAPDLLEALKAMRAYARAEGKGLRICDEAIARAEGETK